MTPPSSKYGPLHALAAGAVLVYAVLSNGVAAFWQQFLHGLNIQLTEKTLLLLLGYNALFFGGLFLILWGTTFFSKARSSSGPPDSSAGRAVTPRPPPHWDNGRLARCARLALLSAIPICLIAMGLNWASGELLSRLADIDLSDQDLVKVVASNTLSPGSKAILYSFVLLEAPFLEEPLFRGIIFGGFSKIMPVWAAMLLSGFLFALVHINAATFIPLWFLGIAFAWLYVRTGTLLVPMAVHFTFNAANLIFCLI
jgi:membrane protease YdiL (CAAX protease family)